MFFVAVIFATEGMFVSSFFLNPAPQMPTSATVAAVGLTGPAAQANSLFHSILRQFGRMALDAQSATPWILGGIATLLMLAIVFAFFVHVQIQQPEMLFSGALVALFAVSLIVTNAQVASVL